MLFLNAFFFRLNSLLERHELNSSINLTENANTPKVILFLSNLVYRHLYMIFCISTSLFIRMEMLWQSAWYHFVRILHLQEALVSYVRTYMESKCKALHQEHGSEFRPLSLLFVLMLISARCHHCSFALYELSLLLTTCSYYLFFVNFVAKIRSLVYLMNCYLSLASR